MCFKAFCDENEKLQAEKQIPKTATRTGDPPVPSLSPIGPPIPACAPTDANPTSASSTRGSGNLGSASEEPHTGFGLWGDATRALMDRVDIVRDLDQRRLAASRCWQRLQVKKRWLVALRFVFFAGVVPDPNFPLSTEATLLFHGSSADTCRCTRKHPARSRR